MKENLTSCEPEKKGQAYCTVSVSSRLDICSVTIQGCGSTQTEDQAILCVAFPAQGFGVEEGWVLERLYPDLVNIHNTFTFSESIISRFQC